MPRKRLSALTTTILALSGVILILAASLPRGFCGFYVGKAIGRGATRPGIAQRRPGNREII